MDQIPIKTTCIACGGLGILTNDKIFILERRDYPLLSNCIACNGQGTQVSWVDVHQFAQMLHAIEVEIHAE